MEKYCSNVMVCVAYYDPLWLYLFWMEYGADDTGISDVPGASFETDADTTLYAQWDRVSYNIVYHPNGGTGTTPNAAAKFPALQTPESIILPSLTHYGLGLFALTPIQKQINLLYL